MSLFDISDDTPDWRVDAACLTTGDLSEQRRDATTDIEPHGSGKTAKRVCAGCTVRPECLADALRHEEQHGVRAGLSAKERHQLRRGGVAA